MKYLMIIATSIFVLGCDQHVFNASGNPYVPGNTGTKTDSKFVEFSSGSLKSTTASGYKTLTKIDSGIASQNIVTPSGYTVQLMVK